jgi:hypothetical protein
MNQAPQSAAIMRMTPEIAMTSGLVRKLYIVAFREKGADANSICEIAELEGFSPGTFPSMSLTREHGLRSLTRR